ncbi:MAG: radical SAM protein [Candidatus Sigynarchaeota archaeon]
MKVALVFPNLFTKNFLRNDSQIHPPLALGYLGAVLRNAGHEVSVIDASAERLDGNKIVNRLKKGDFEIVGITSNIASSIKAVQCAKIIRERIPSIKVIMGGPWATVEYRGLLKQNLADVVVLGEGEVTFIELLESIRNKNDFSRVNGIAFRDSNNNIIVTPSRPLIMNLDTLPFPAWDLLPKNGKYNFVHRKKPFYPIMTSRGCPYDCIHCTKIVHGYIYRKRSVTNVIAEIEYLVKNFNMKELLIIDDCFNLDIQRANEIFDEIIKRKFNIIINFSNGIRADFFDKNLAKKFYKAGVYAISFGIESGNQEIVNKIGKKLDLKAVENAVALAKRFNILTKGFFIIGHPYDTFNTMMQTASFARKIDLDFPHFFKSIPFPGTKMYDIIKTYGRLSVPSIRRVSDEIQGYTKKKAYFDIWNINSEDIERAFINSYRSFYLRPRKLIHIFFACRSWSEMSWLIMAFIKIIIRYIF